MNDPVWYYAHGDSEKGPLTTVQIKALAAAGKIRRDGFVWKEGMETWVPAREVAELYPKEAKANSTSSSAEKMQDKRAQQQALVPSVSESRKPPAIQRPLGHVTLACGLLAVLLARGCDSLGQRHVDRLRAIAEANPRRFEEQWQRQRDLLEDQLQSLTELTNRTPPQKQRMTSLTEALAQLDDEMQTRRQQLRQGDWRTQRSIAQAAEDEDHIWGFWREAAFLGGTMILAAGLLAVAFTGNGPDRWICLAILGAILYSVYLSNPW